MSYYLSTVQYTEPYLYRACQGYYNCEIIILCCQGGLAYDFLCHTGVGGPETFPSAPGVRFPATLTLTSRGRRLDVSCPAMVSIELQTSQEESHTHTISDSVARYRPATGST